MKYLTKTLSWGPALSRPCGDQEKYPDRCSDGGGGEMDFDNELEMDDPMGVDPMEDPEGPEEDSMFLSPDEVPPDAGDPAEAPPVEEGLHPYWQQQDKPWLDEAREILEERAKKGGADGEAALRILREGPKQPPEERKRRGRYNTQPLFERLQKEEPWSPQELKRIRELMSED